ncbi:MAG: aromatic acid exporter family protein [Peptococcaceae bacterium]|nr:aromatic acid exporter family protein [Peptococcaceae bacterium]
MNIGARTLKTGIAVALSVYICMLLKIEPPLFAATSAVVCMQQSIGKSLKNALEQVIVNLIAIAVGIILGMTVPVLFISMALATIIVILICTRVYQAQNHIVLAIISAIFILASPQVQFLDHALVRSLAILIGIVTANIINLAISPPRYRKTLESKLIKLNNLVVQRFSESLNRYLHLNVPTEEEINRNQQEFLALYEEAERLYDLYRDEWNVPAGNRNITQKTGEEKFLKEYLNYNRGLWQRSQDLLFLAGERKMRREEANDPKISCEFNHIFEMLLNVMFNATTYNLELQKKIRGEQAAIYPEPRVWSKLHDLLNQWQEKNPPTSYYMHALMEVSIITYNIRWFAKESTRLLSYSLTEKAF